jgi:hypothetical protein
LLLVGVEAVVLSPPQGESKNRGRGDSRRTFARPPIRAKPAKRVNPTAAAVPRAHPHLI